MMAGCDVRVGYPIQHWDLHLEGQNPIAVDLPAHLNAEVAGRQTYRLDARLVVPERLRKGAGKVVAPKLHGLATLRSNGRELIALNHDWVELSPHPQYRAVGSQAWRIPAEVMQSGALDLELTIRHRSVLTAWIDVAPRLVGLNERDVHDVRLEVINFVGSALGALTVGYVGIMYLFMFLIDTRRKTYLWFAVQGVTAAILPCYYLGILQFLFGTNDVSALGIALGTAPIASVYFSHAQFNLKPPSRWWAVGLGLHVLLSIAFRDPFLAVNIVSPITVGIVFLACVYQIQFFGRRIWSDIQEKRETRGQPLLLAAWVFLASTSWTDMLFWMGLVDPFDGVRLSGFGLAVFASLQSFFLSREHIHALNRSDDLNTELEHRVQLLETRQSEIQHLNLELRRQIADRSGRLFAVLRLLGGRTSHSVLSPGDIVDERYKVVRKLGAGGMGAVHEVVRFADKKRVAMKVATCADGMSVARLAREAQIAAQVTHPNIVSILDVNISGSGFLYIVMELAEGPSLKQMRMRYGDMDWGLKVLAQIADGLVALHAHGIVHRDLKPANVLVVGSHVKITDFGISRLNDATASGIPLAPKTASLPDLVHDAVTREDTDSGDTMTASFADYPDAGFVAEDDSVENSGASDPALTEATALMGSSTTNAHRARAEKNESFAQQYDSLSSNSGSSSPNSSLTRTGLLTGTPLYLAPELATGELALSSAADVFSFGVVASQVLFDRLPFDEPPFVSVLQERPIEREVSFQDVSSVPAAVGVILDACLSIEPENRPTAHQLAAALHGDDPRAKKS